MKKSLTAKHFDEDALIAERGPEDLDCMMRHCTDRATRSGLCEDCLMVVAMSLKQDARTLDGLCATPVPELQRTLAEDGLCTTTEQCNAIKCYLVVMWREIPKLSETYVPDGLLRRAELRDVLLSDYGRSDVADAAKNRARRSAFFASQPKRLKVPDAPAEFSATELEALDRLQRQALHDDGVPAFEQLPCTFEGIGLCVVVLVGLVITCLAGAAQYLKYGGKF
jgi:hypothetical protein